MTAHLFGSLSSKSSVNPMSNISFKRFGLAGPGPTSGIPDFEQAKSFTLPHLALEASSTQSSSRCGDPSIPSEAVEKQTELGPQPENPVKADPIGFSIEQLKDLKVDLHSHFGQSTGEPSWDPDVDLNNDGRIDIRDKRLARDAKQDYKTLVREHFGKTASDGDWNPNADLNNDGRVDIRDKAMVRDLLV